MRKPALKGVIALLLISLPVIAVDEPVPSPAEQAQLIVAMREAAMAFDKNLPNFLCLQMTHREMRREMDLNLGVHASGGRGGGSSFGGGLPTSNGSWQPVDNFEQQLTYFDRHENYVLTKRNGKPAKKGESNPAGLTTSGEFGSTLVHIFEPESKADFEWKKADTLRGHPVYVFAFRIQQENSVAQLTAGKRVLIVPYHGLVYIDRETHKVLRVSTEAETPNDFPLQGVKHLLDYGTFIIGGEKYVLPLHAETETKATEEFMRDGRLGGNLSKLATLRNTVDFSAYKKYGTDSELKPE